ncbi:MFS transporter [Streptomyces sp. 6N223]|uniref:MFS transporter n=1 Tax=Streptomyces sp. 6N223 TaxID=3457412 RepID=UPI003FD52CFE
MPSSESSPHADHHPHAAAQPAAHPHRWRLLAVLCLAQFMLIADVTVINVALPTIGEELSLSPGAVTWVVTAYTLFFGSLLLLGGRLADALGTLRMFLAGLVVFAAASIASGLATGGGMLIAARSAQGVGAALLSPAAMALVVALFHGPDRHKALGAWAAIGGAGAAVGVLLGGVFVSGPGWEWIFYINVPVGLLALVAVPALLGEGRAHLTRPSAERSRPDLPGALTLTATPALLIYGLVQARDHGFTDASAWLPLALALAAAAAFVAVERAARDPLVRLELLARRTLVGGGVVMLVASGLLISVFFLNSFYVQHVLGRSALATGLAFLPVAVAITLGAHLGSSAVPRLGWRPVAATGFVLAAAGALLLTGLSPDSGTWTGVVPGFALFSLGIGPAFVCATTAAMTGLPHQDTGLASGLVNTAHELGASLGVAVIAAIAGASLEGGHGGAGPVDAGGFDNAFTAVAVIAAAGALAAAFLLPPGRPAPAQGPVFAH